MKSFWGFQVEAQGVRNKQRLLDYHRRVKPPWTTVLEGDGLGMEIIATSPSTNVISRHFFDDGTWYKASPKDFLDYLDRAKVPDELWCFVENESGINPQWNIDLIKLNAQRAKPRKLAILSLAVGTPPNPDEWKDPKVLELLRLCDQYREWIVICLHEYFIAVVTSGLIGGAPDNAGMPLGSPMIGDDLIPKAAWPKKERNLTRWHMGRFAFMVNACKGANPPINPPRVVLTEAGADDVSDIKTWAEKLDKTPPYTSIRGWRSLVNQWAKWYPGVSSDQVYADMLTYAADVIYADSVVEGGCIYCWATPDPKWEQFNVEPYEDFITALEKAVDVSKTSTQEIVSAGMPKPSNAGVMIRARAKTPRNLRNGAGTKYIDQGIVGREEIEYGDEIIFYDYPPTVSPDDNTSWRWCEIKTGKYAGREGWFQLTGFSYDKLVTKPLPPPDSTPIPVPTEPPSTTIDEPPVTDDDTQKPPIHDFTIHVRVKTADPTAAKLTAVWATQLLQNRWKDLDDMKELFRLLDSIDDVQFEMV